MIRAIAAIDSKRGIADDNGIPWQGKIPSDVKFFREKTSSGGLMLMGHGTYMEFAQPLPGRENLVATRRPDPLKEGFTAVHDAAEFLENSQEDVWVIGGAKLFEQTLDFTDELYLSKLEGDFGCTKFFPPYEDKFELTSQSEPITENGIVFTFCIYKRKK